MLIEYKGEKHAVPEAAGSSFADLEAFDRLYRDHYRHVVNLCRRLLGSGHDTEAIAQEVFVRAWRSRGSFQADRHFWPWIATIARRLCVNELSGGARRQELLGRVGPSADRAAGADKALDEMLMAAEVRHTLRRLPGRHRRFLQLRDLEGWTYEEIARFDGITVESVRSTLKRARAAFRRVYEEGAFVGVGVFLRRLGWLRRDGERWVATVGGRIANPAGLAIAVAMLLPLSSAPSITTPDRGGHATAAPTSPATVAIGTMPTAAADGHASKRQAAPSASPTTTASPSRTDTAFAAPVDADIDEFTPSPSYRDDHTVFATGISTTCSSPVEEACPAMYKSTDAGATWERLPAEGRDRGTLLLPPAFPHDSRIFSQSGSALSVSDDGGRTFRHLTAIQGPVTMSPLFSTGDPRFLVGNQWGRPGPLFEYRDGDSALRLLSLPLPAGVVPFTVLFGPSYAGDSRILVAGHRMREGAPVGLLPVESVVLSCGDDGCTPVLEDIGIPQFVGGTGPMVYVLADDLFRSRDAGRSFEPVDMPPERANGFVSALAADDDGRLFLSVFERGFADHDLFVSNDEGETWRRVTGVDSEFLIEMLVLPDGRVLAAPAHYKGKGVRCSVDSGRTWAERCPASN